MLEKHNRMLVELLSKQQPSGSLTAADVHSLMKVLLSSGVIPYAICRARILIPC